MNYTTKALLLVAWCASLVMLTFGIFDASFGILR